MTSDIRTGWGKTSQSTSPCLDVSNFLTSLESNESECGLPVGLGRSYGDSSLNSDGIQWSSTSLNQIIIDSVNGVATCGSGATIGELERASLKFGFFPPTVPGTEFVSIGGAIASNIHGKSHNTHGAFSASLLEIKIMDATGSVSTLSPTGDSGNRFWATVGGMGLTGFVISARIKLIKVETAQFKVDEKRAKNLQSLLEIIDEFDSAYDYTAAWIDMSGDFSGRGLVIGGNHANLNDLPQKLKRVPLKIKTRRNFRLPKLLMFNYVSPIFVRIFNEIWFRKPLKKGISSTSIFLHPLDSISNWNLLYGKNGIIQYQFQIPLDQSAFLFEFLKDIKRVKGISPLTVLKKFGPTESKYLSFPKGGWTLAVDMPAKLKGLHDALYCIDDKLVKAGGRVYLTKDSRLSKEHFQLMYPEHLEWIEIKRAMDPSNYWQSDQGRRLGLC